MKILKKEKIKKLKEKIEKHISLVENISSDKFLENIVEVSYLITKCIKSGNKVLICGNGGSAADSQHFAGEMVGRFKKERNSLPFISLTTDSSIITSIGNDYDFKYIFSRQIEGIGNKNDILICFSTSGESKNIIEAAKKAKEKKMKVICLTGKTPNTLEKFSDFKISVPSKETDMVQQIHILIYHLLSEIIEEAFLNGKD